ncbi:MAG TPA: crosslink repair DNA glycosylase YcaQ family protein [Limnochordales bacterium]
MPRRDASPKSTITPAALRRLILARSGLLRWTRGRRPHVEGVPWRDELHGEDGALQALRRLEAVQLDPVAVVERNHHLVLRNRVGAYRSEHLESLYRRKLVFEYWANARCVLPADDYPVFEPVRALLRAAWPPFPPPLQQAITYVRDRLAAEGPLPARRRFGPYTMPVLEGDRFIGRLDARLDRAERTLYVERLMFEPGVEVSAERLARVRGAIETLAEQVGSRRVVRRPPGASGAGGAATEGGSVP